MRTPILLPKLGFSMSEATLAQWLVTDGAQVREGQPLYNLESDKSMQEIEAPASGTLRIAKQAGETYPVGTVLGEIDLTGPGVRHGSAVADEEVALLDPVSRSVEIYNRWPGEEFLAMSRSKAVGDCSDRFRRMLP